jgi:cytochrome c nitrite reductase small subunit
MSAGTAKIQTRSSLRYWSGVPAFVLCVLVGMALGTGGYTVHYAEGLSYLSSDPKACVNCHVMRDEYDGWQKSSHHAVATCNDCHVPHAFIPKYLVKAENGLWHSKGFTLQDYHEPIRLRDVSLKILNHNCRDCHHDLISGMHGDHEFEYETASCVHCHGSVGHGPQR